MPRGDAGCAADDDDDEVLAVDESGRPEAGKGRRRGEEVHTRRNDRCRGVGEPVPARQYPRFGLCRVVNVPGSTRSVLWPPVPPPPSSLPLAFSISSLILVQCYSKGSGLSMSPSFVRSVWAGMPADRARCGPRGWRAGRGAAERGPATGGRGEVSATAPWSPWAGGRRPQRGLCRRVRQRLRGEGGGRAN